MSAQVIVIALLALVTLLAIVRLLRLSRLGVPASLAVKTQWALLLLLQPALALLLSFALFPPDARRGTGAMVVLTAGATPAQLERHRDAARIVALPGSPQIPEFSSAVRVPDLATALRKFPGSTRLQVLGAGLPARDRESLRGLPLAFDASPLPHGLLELWSPAQVRAGARWRLDGRIGDVPGGRVELLDPGERRIDRMALGKDGRFVLRGSARGEGRAHFKLRVLDARQAVVEEIDVPVSVVAGAPLRVLVLAGGPDPELKYLRRWATDAGLSLHTRISLGGGIELGDGAMAMDAASLAALDLVVLDERAWRGLGSGSKAALLAALRDGLGILLRITGPLSASERGELRALGFAVADADIATSVALPASTFEPEKNEASATASTYENDQTVALTRRPLRVLANDGASLLRDDGNAPLALWRGEGRGRIALWWLSDSHRLVLAGQSAAHGQIWSDAFGTLARARSPRQPNLRDHDPRPQQRLQLCGVSKEASVVAPSGERTPLRVDVATGCAAYWPGTAGWFVVQDGALQQPFHVRAVNEAPGLVAQSLREATRQLVATAQPSAARTEARVPGSPWPWSLAWLVCAALSWWLERRLLRSR